MSEFDFNDVSTPEGLLEVSRDDSVRNSYINDYLDKINDKLLESLTKKLSYSDDYKEQWGDVKVGWRKSL